MHRLDRCGGNTLLRLLVEVLHPDYCRVLDTLDGDCREGFAMLIGSVSDIDLCR